MKQGNGRGRSNVPGTIYRGISIGTAILLLTGQITIGGVFLAPGDFALSLSGPFTGSGSVGKTDRDNMILDGLDVITAFLLILDQVQVIGAYVTAGRFTIVVGGPFFGGSATEAYTPTAKGFFRDFGSLAVSRYNPFKGES